MAVDISVVRVPPQTLPGRRTYTIPPASVEWIILRYMAAQIEDYSRLKVVSFDIDRDRGVTIRVEELDT